MHGYWRRSPDRIAHDMRLEGHSDAFIDDVNTFVGGQVLAIDWYLAGHLDAREEGEQGGPDPQAGRISPAFGHR